MQSNERKATKRSGAMSFSPTNTYTAFIGHGTKLQSHQARFPTTLYQISYIDNGPTIIRQLSAFSAQHYYVTASTLDYTEQFTQERTYVPKRSCYF